MAGFEAICWFKIFSKYFSYTDVLYNILQTTTVYNVYTIQKVNDIIR